MLQSIFPDVIRSLLDNFRALQSNQQQKLANGINIERTLFDQSSDDFTVKVVKKPDEIKALLEVGFEYVCEKDHLIFMRKRK